MKFRHLLISLFFATALPAAPSWIWYPAGTPSTAFRKSIPLDEEVKSAVFHMACDGRALINLNGKLPFAGTQTPWLNLVILKVQRYDMTKAFVKGENLFAVSAWPGEQSAGFICKGEIVLASGKTVIVDSDSSWLAFDRESFRVPGEELWQSKNPRNWNQPGGDFSHWKPAKELGPPDLEPYCGLLDPTLLRRDDHYSTDPARQGRLMLDDFADISSWLGGPRRGHDPSATRPVYFSFGSIPAPERDDGFCGEFRFAFREKNGVAGFSKNAVVQTWSIPVAITFSADTAGRTGGVSFEFEDKSGKQITTREVPITGGDGWHDYRLPFDGNVPVAMRQLIFRLDEPGTGGIRFDDLAFEADVSNPRKQIDIHPEYGKLAHAPDTPVELAFRVRNALREPVQCTFLLRVFSPDGTLERTQTAATGIPAGGVGKIRFALDGFSRLGPYRIELAAANGKEKNVVQGWLGVFVPNNGRVNKLPMWFGIEDQEFHTAPYEVKLHAEWMKLLGVDLLRGIFMGGASQYERGAAAGLEAFAKLWQPHFDAGLDLLLDYAADVPPWTISDAKKQNDRNWYRNQMADRPEMLAEHIRDVAKFMAKHPQIKYFEWLNEPDLNGFRGTADEYIASLKLIYPIIKQTAPNVKVTTGGMVVTHPYGKPDFTRRVYTECAGFYDIAAFHCHDDINAYKRYHEAILNTGVSKPIANTEAGCRSYLSAPSLFFAQAATLVKKIAWAKSRNSEFYIWFMLQDYWDKYVNADDSFGLVTVDNQPKPSFIAYNELIRQLANAIPAGEASLDARLETLRFRRGAEEIFVCWPVKPGAFHFSVQSTVPVSFIDIFGNRREFPSQGNSVSLTASELPFYLTAPAGTLTAGRQTLVPAAGSAGVPGETTGLQLTLTNTIGKKTEFFLTGGDSRTTALLAPDESKTIRLPITIDAGAVPGSTVIFPAELSANDVRQPVILPVAVALPVPPITAPAAILKIDSADALTELAFDPVTPRWSGPEDLSAEISVRHDQANLYFDIAVRDQEHNTPFDGINIWKNDSIQLAFSPPEGKPTEITVSGNQAWRHIAPAPQQIGKLEIPTETTRTGNTTRYKFTIPLAEVGLSPQTTLFRLSILINDNDQGKRLRLMEWGRGIEGDKSPELFNWAKLL